LPYSDYTIASLFYKRVGYSSVHQDGMGPGGDKKEAPDERFVGWGERFVWRHWKITLKEV
jgi:hypothetical protein